MKLCGVCGSEIPEGERRCQPCRAWHEAGHAVLHVLYEIPFKRVTLERVVSGAKRSPERDRLDLRQRFGGCIAECIRAGFSEECILGLRPTVELCGSPRGGGQDLAHASSLANLVAGEELGEGAARDRLNARRWELMEEAAREAIRALCEPRHERALGLIATELIARGELSPPEVAELMERAATAE